MDLDTFNEVVTQFNTKYPPQGDGISGFLEEIGEFYKEVSIGNWEKASEEFSDALFVLLGIANYYNLDLAQGLHKVAQKNHKKIIENSLVLGPNGKWLKAEDAARVR